MGTDRPQARGEVGGQVVLEVVGGQQRLLDLVIEAQLANRHQDCPVLIHNNDFYIQIQIKILDLDLDSDLSR